MVAGHDLGRPSRERRVSMGVEEPALYVGPVFVRTRWPWESWVSWNSRFGGGPILVVKADSFEVSAPQGMLLESRHLVFRSSTATMWIDEVGWAGTRFSRKKCIHVAAEHKASRIELRLGRRIELALSPRDGLQHAWQALLASGVAAKRVEDGRARGP
jgi:hypothetical protein